MVRSSTPSIYNSFSSRVATYPSEYFDKTIIRTLALNGFYYDDYARVSRCYECGITLLTNIIIIHNTGCPLRRQLRMRETIWNLDIRPNAVVDSSFIGRLFSFKEGWQCVGEVGPDEIAWAGFRFTGHGDYLECPFCDIVIHYSSYPSISLSYHRQLNWHCPFVKEIYQSEDPLDQL